ncbi:ricin-type beta-trefoil lectin domain protein [Streptomyces sp. NPDC018610]|uniref:ricin-type beta-trefoil lectin domain protein n=1 Tax=Streptomyces sp. NPDC018610 TaxID=3365049 RepID=UPI0037B850B8
MKDPGLSDSPEPPGPFGTTDQELSAELRKWTGATPALHPVGELLDRHWEAAFAYARLCTDGPHPAGMLTTQAFTRLFGQSLRRAGPTAAWRPRLLVTVRRIAGEWSTDHRRETLHPDLRPAADAGGERIAARLLPPAGRRLLSRAFQRLPQTAAALLWHAEAEGEPLAAPARLLGLGEGDAHVELGRARERLREECLLVHRELAPDQECLRYFRLLDVTYRRGGVDVDPDLRRHLAGCPHCRHTAGQLAPFDTGLGTALAEGVLGWRAREYRELRLAAAAASQAPAQGPTSKAGGRDGSGPRYGSGFRTAAAPVEPVGGEPFDPAAPGSPSPTPDGTPGFTAAGRPAGRTIGVPPASSGFPGPAGSADSMAGVPPAPGAVSGVAADAASVPGAVREAPYRPAGHGRPAPATASAADGRSPLDRLIAAARGRFPSAGGRSPGAAAGEPGAGPGGERAVAPAPEAPQQARHRAFGDAPGTDAGSGSVHRAVSRRSARRTARRAARNRNLAIAAATVSGLVVLPLAVWSALGSGDGAAPGTGGQPAGRSSAPSGASAPAPAPSWAGAGRTGRSTLRGRLHNAASGLCVGIVGEKAVPGAETELAKCASEPGQQWAYETDGLLRSGAAPGLCLDSHLGYSVQLAPCTAAAAPGGRDIRYDFTLQGTLVPRFDQDLALTPAATDGAGALVLKTRARSDTQRWTIDASAPHLQMEVAGWAPQHGGPTARPAPTPGAPRP